MLEDQIILRNQAISLKNLGITYPSKFYYGGDIIQYGGGDDDQYLHAYDLGELSIMIENICHIYEYVFKIVYKHTSWECTMHINNYDYEFMAEFEVHAKASLIIFLLESGHISKEAIN